MYALRKSTLNDFKRSRRSFIAIASPAHWIAPRRCNTAYGQHERTFCNVGFGETLCVVPHLEHPAWDRCAPVAISPAAIDCSASANKLSSLNLGAYHAERLMLPRQLSQLLHQSINSIQQSFKPSSPQLYFSRMDAQMPVQPSRQFLLD